MPNAKPACCGHNLQRCRQALDARACVQGSLAAANQPVLVRTGTSRSNSHRSSRVLGVLVRAYACDGRRTEALRVLGELHRRRQAGYVPPAAFLNVYLGLGDTEEAFTWLGRAAEERSPITQYLKVHPFFDPLRGDPRFAVFLRRASFQ